MLGMADLSGNWNAISILVWEVLELVITHEHCRLDIPSGESRKSPCTHYSSVWH